MKLRLDFHDIAWWYWLVSWGLIVAGMAGWGTGFMLLLILSIWQVPHFAFREKSVTAFSVQVRAGFVLFVLTALQFPFLFWVPVFGLLARVTVNYCLLARCLSLLPWNRREPLRWDLVRRTLFTPPVDGSIVDNRPS